MTVSKELYLAILSMDSYSRGSGAGIADGGKDDPDCLGEAGSEIGHAIVKKVDLPTGSQAAGFYAVAYTMGEGPDVPSESQGKTILSCRGTDAPVDDLKGWLIGAGAAGRFTQCGAAMELSGI